MRNQNLILIYALYRGVNIIAILKSKISILATNNLI